MAMPNTKCRVCGKEYFCCSDSRQIGSWRTMACSIECYKEYMRRIEDSRKHVVESIPETEKPKIRKRKSVNNSVIDIEIV